MSQSECLTAALTLLVRSEVLKEEDVLKAIYSDGYAGVFKVIEDKYKEIWVNENQA